MSTKKRIAVLLTGHMRCYDKCFQALKDNFLDLNADYCEIDLFILTYQQRENVKWYPGIRKGVIDVSNIQEIYSPYLTKMEILDDTKFRYRYPLLRKKYYAPGDLSRLMTTGLLIKRGDEMVKKYSEEQNIQYDYYLKFRADLLLTTPIKISELEWDRFDLFVPLLKSGGAKTYKFCDWFFLGRYSTVSQVLNYVDKMVVFDQHNIIDISFIESYILLYIQSLHIKMDRIDIQIVRERMD